MLNTHLTHVKEVSNLMLMGKFPGLLAQLGGLDVLAGGVVVQDNRNFVFVKNLRKASLFKLRNCHGGGDVVAQHQVQPGLNELARLHLVQPSGFG